MATLPVPVDEIIAKWGPHKHYMTKESAGKHQYEKTNYRTNGRHRNYVFGLHYWNIYS